MQEQYIALQRLTRMRYHLVYNLTREKQYFLQNLFFKCNAFRSEVDSSVFGHAIMEMLSERFSLDDIANMDLADLADYLIDKGRNRFPDPEYVALCNRKKYNELPKHQHKTRPRLNGKKTCASGRCAATQRSTVHAWKKGKTDGAITVFSNIIQNSFQFQ